MATANKGSSGAGEAQWYSLPVDSRLAPGFARRTHLPRPDRGFRVAVFSSSQDIEGLLEKEGEGGRPPSCFLGLLGSLARVFQRVACNVACRRSSPGKWIGRLSWLEALGS